MNRCYLAVFALFAALPPSLMAHPGHGVMDHGAGHVVTSPFHLAGLLAVAIAFFAAARVMKNPATKRLLRGAGATALLLVAAVWALKL
jgi:hypothetical protein